MYAMYVTRVCTLYGPQVDSQEWAEEGYVTCKLVIVDFW